MQNKDDAFDKIVADINKTIAETMTNSWVSDPPVTSVAGSYSYTLPQHIDYINLTFTVSAPISAYSVFIINFLQLYKYTYCLAIHDYAPIIAKISIIAFPDASLVLPICLPEIAKYIKDNWIDPTWILNCGWIVNYAVDSVTINALYTSSKLFNDLVKLSPLGPNKHLDTLIQVKRGNPIDPDFKEVEKIYADFKVINPFWAIK